MIDTAWDEYRAWAARARALQNASRFWNKAALTSAGAAAVFGAAAVQMSAYPQLVTGLSLASAIAAGAVPFLGKEILETGAEAKWIRARATAETIKSECFRYGARVGGYAGADADDVFEKRREELSNAATKEGLISEPNPVGSRGDERRPAVGLTADWYTTHRIDDQIAFYRKRGKEHENAANRLRWAAFVASGVAALFGFAGVVYQATFAPWIGAMTTIAAAVAAQGLMSRYQQLAASYSAMADGLARIKDRKLGLGDLVTRAEDLMQSEHAAWVEHMTKTIPKPPVAPATPANRVEPAKPGG